MTSKRYKLTLSKPNRTNTEATAAAAGSDTVGLKKRRHLPENNREGLSAAKRQYVMLNGYQNSSSSSRAGNGSDLADPPFAALSNMGNTCFLNSVLYSLRFAPTFLHNLHHLIRDLNTVNARLAQYKARTSSLGRNMSMVISGQGNRSTSSKDLLSLSSSSEAKTKVQIVTEKLHELFIAMHNIELKESTDPYQPLAFLQAVKEANCIFQDNNQQDAHELLVYLLDNIREACDVLAQQVQNHPELLLDSDSASSIGGSSGSGNSSSGSSGSSTSSKLLNLRKSWKKSYKKKDAKVSEVISEHIGDVINGSTKFVILNEEDNQSTDGGNNGENSTSNKKKLGYNFIAEDFEGITLRRTKCLECECVTERKEPFYDIPVPMSVTEMEDFDLLSPSDIYRRACVTNEKLCDPNKYFCETCCRLNEASREVLFERLPNIMVLQLKRFTTTASGIQKVNTHLPTPLELQCFCESCCDLEEEAQPLHRYQLCCVIMHLGGSMTTGHYIAFVRANTGHFTDYAECDRDQPRGSLSASSSEKSINFLKYLKPRNLGNSFIEARNGFSASRTVNGLRLCRSIDCCGVRLTKNVTENVINNYMKKRSGVSDFNAMTYSADNDMWLECDDEAIRPITTAELNQELGYKPNSTSTPYLLFYTKINENGID